MISSSAPVGTAEFGLSATRMCQILTVSVTDTTLITPFGRSISRLWVYSILNAYYRYYRWRIPIIRILNAYYSSVANASRFEGRRIRIIFRRSRRGMLSLGRIFYDLMVPWLECIVNQWVSAAPLRRALMRHVLGFAFGDGRSERFY